jgi:hypothetical protein
VTERVTKKRRRETPAVTPWGDVPLDALPEGDEKERVRRAMRCFDAGDHAQVRALADALAGSSEPAVRAAAEALRSRVRVDPVQLAVVGACALVLVLVALHYLT